MYVAVIITVSLCALCGAIGLLKESIRELSAGQ
jgi:hypothetical protein